jgi:hypothetical protein
MRKQKTIALSDTAKVTLMELRPRDIKHTLGMMQGGADLDFEKLLTENWDDALAKLQGVIQADGIELEDLSFSEIAEVKDAFMEVNAAFFGLLSGLGLNLAAVGASSNMPSIAPASSSSSAGTETSSATAGASS